MLKLRFSKPFVMQARDLVIEALLNIATRKAAPRFKADIRTHGGLDVVSEATIDAVDYLKDLIDSTSSFSAIAPSSSNKPNPTGLDDFALDNLKRVGYYAKMLENVGFLNAPPLHLELETDPSLNEIMLLRFNPEHAATSPPEYLIRPYIYR